MAEAAQNPKHVVAAFWSVNYEERSYLVMALGLLLATRYRVPLMRTVVLTGAIGLLWNLAWPAGWVTGLFIEYWAHFVVGVLLFSVLSLWPSPATRVIFVAILAGVCAFCLYEVLPWTRDTELQSRAYAELAVVSAFALLLFFARPFSAAISRHALWRPVAALGAISYSLYLVHQFNLTLVEGAVHAVVPPVWRGVQIAAMVALEIAIATAFWYCCERPFLNQHEVAAGRRISGSTGSRLHPSTSTRLPRPET